jgi:hypothetical protein
MHILIDMYKYTYIYMYTWTASTVIYIVTDKRQTTEKLGIPISVIIRVQDLQNIEIDIYWYIHGYLYMYQLMFIVKFCILCI